MYYVMPKLIDVKSNRRSNDSRRVWPPPELEFIKMQAASVKDYSGLLENYVPMRGHGCRSWQDGTFD